MHMHPTIRTWTRNGWTLTADRSQVFPDDPGAGAPLMVASPFHETGTLFCVCDTGEIDYGAREVPAAILAWLEDITDEAETFVFGS